jgi:hypothetical protein
VKALKIDAAFLRVEKCFQRVKQELERLGMYRGFWKNGEENNRNVWREVSKRCVDIERQYESKYEREKVTGVLQ